MDSATPAQRTASYLRHLLARPGPYRRRWETRAARLRSAEINQRAVCKVLATKLWDEGHDIAENSLKDRVARALHGDVLSPETLTWFIDAFAIDPDHADTLWAQLLSTDTEQVRVVTGELAAPPSYPVQAEAREYRTISLHEYHRIGADGLPADHRSIHVIESLTDGLTRYPYRFDTNAAVVEVIRGGRAGPLSRFSDNLYAVDIIFSEPLDRGRTASLEYQTVFNYREPPPREFRRAVFRRLESLHIRVEFHPDRLPSAVWWSEWEDLDGPVVRQEQVYLDGEHGVHRYLSALERAIVGFHWDW